MLNLAILIQSLSGELVGKTWCDGWYCERLGWLVVAGIEQQQWSVDTVIFRYVLFTSTHWHHVGHKVGQPFSSLFCFPSSLSFPAKKASQRQSTRL